MHSGLKTVGMGTLRGNGIFYGLGLIDLTVRVLESLTTILASPLILVVFCFFAGVLLTREALLARGDTIRMFDTREPDG